MADETTVLSDHQAAMNLGALLATHRDHAGEGEEPEQEEAPAGPEGTDEGEDTDLSLSDQTEDDAEASGEAEEESEDEDGEGTETPEFSLPYKYKGKDYQMTDAAEATRYVQLGKHFEERQHDIVRREQAAEQADTEADQLRSRYANGLKEVAQFFEQVAGEPPKEADFKDRAAYLEALNQHNQAQQAVTVYQKEQQRVQAEQVSAQRKRLEAWADKEEEATLAAVPEWHDTAVRQADVKRMGEYAEQIGVPAQALNNPLLANAKWFRVLLRDAARYEQAAAAGATEVEKTRTKDAAPGSGTGTRTDGTSKRRRELTDRAAKSGKVEDAAVIGTQLMQRHRQLTRNAKR